MAESGSKESTYKADHWVEFTFVDTAGNPVSGLPYEFTAPDGKRSESFLQSDGTVRRDGLPRGDCKVHLFNVCHARWSGTTARVGDPVTLSASVEGFSDKDEATFVIYKRDIDQPDREMARLTAHVHGKTVEVKWQHPKTTEANDAEAERHLAAPYSSPEYYFDVFLGPCRIHSPALRFEETRDLSLKDEKGTPLANAEYALRLPDGSVRRGRLNGQGERKEEKMPVGSFSIIAPRHARSQL